MPNINDLGQKVKAKYPGTYDDLDDAEDGQRVKSKFPGAYNGFTDAPVVSAKKPGLGGFVLKDVTGQAAEADRPEGMIKGFASDVFQSTLGSSGATGLAQAPVRPIATKIGAEAQIDIQKSRQQLAESADKYIEMAKGEQDPARKKKLLALAGDTLRQTETLQKESEEVNKITPQSTSSLGDIER